MKAEKPSYDRLVEALKETDRFLQDRMTGVPHGSEELTCLMGNKHILEQLESKLEPTLEDCVENSQFHFSHAYADDNYGKYPTESIAYKVFLYGLLQSVAHKLNESCNGKYVIRLDQGRLVPYIVVDIPSYGFDCFFFTPDLANQAISIFAKSKFDLKKLYQ